jgi:predicted outer membrane repeat protein
MKRLTIVLAALSAVFAVQIGTASAAGPGPFHVDVTYDAQDAVPGDGACDDGSGHCPLRAAVEEANAAWTTWVDIDVPSGYYPLKLSSAIGGLKVSYGMGIFGKGPRRTIVDALGYDRIFDVRADYAAIGGMSLWNGRTKDGAGIRAAHTRFLRLDWLEFTGNNASYYGGGFAGYDAHVSVTRTTFVDNTARNLGGAIYLQGYGVAHADLENVTLHANSSERGGGIFADDAPLTLRNVTIANNHAALGGGIYHLGVAPEAYNTIVAYSTGQDCASPITSVANSLDTDKTCGFFGPGDLPGTDPFLDGLTFAGAPPLWTANWVRPLLSGSPAIDAGDNGTCAKYDERGLERLVLSPCDIGAYEYS